MLIWLGIAWVKNLVSIHTMSAVPWLTPHATRHERVRVVSARRHKEAHVAAFSLFNDDYSFSIIRAARPDGLVSMGQAVDHM